MRRLVLFMLVLAMVIPFTATQAAEDTYWTVLEPYTPGIIYDTDRQSWYFYGVVGEIKEFFIPGASIDLAEIHYRLDNSGHVFSVWVALGLNCSLGLQCQDAYLTRGPWISTNNARRWLAGTVPVRVSISSNDYYGNPAVSETGVDWSVCKTIYCQYAATFDDMHMDFSNRFIETGAAPSWYPWGFLFWYVEPLAGDGVMAAVYQHSTGDTQQWTKK